MCRLKRTDGSRILEDISTVIIIDFWEAKATFARELYHLLEVYFGKWLEQ